MRCECVYKLVLEEAEAMEAIYGVTLISGVTVDDKAQVARFFFSNHRDLLRPLVTSLFFPKKKYDIEKICRVYRKKCIHHRMLWVVIYSKDRARIFLNNIARNIFRYKVL